MHQAQLRALLAEKSKALPALKSKALVEGASTEDRTALRSHLDEMKSINEQLDTAIEAEAMEAKLAKPDSAPPATTPATTPTVPAEAKSVEEGDSLALVGAAVMKSRYTGVKPLKILEDEGYGQFAQKLHASQKAVNTLVSGEGGILVPAAQVGGGLIPLLRKESTFLDAGPVRVRFTNGQFKQGRGASGATASYVAEGARKPVSTPTFDAIDMRARKLAGIVPLTREATMWTVGDIQNYVREDLRQSIATVLDLNAWLGTGAGASPTGVLNKAGVTVVTPTFASATAPTIVEIDRMASQMVLAMTANNLAMNARWRWVMSYRTAMFISDMRVGGTNGDLAYPGMQGQNKTFKDIPVVVTNQFPTTGGAGTDETLIALVDFTHVLFGEEEGIVMRYSEEASLDPDGTGTAMIHLFQMNMVAILAETMHDFGLRYSKAVVRANAIRF